MNFISQRDIVVRSIKTGQSIRFKKGEPRDVPSNMHQEVLDRGIIPVEGEDSAQEVTAAVVAGEAPEIKLAPEDADVRNAAILAAIKAIVARNNAKDFTAGGMPSASAVSTAVGWRTDAKEIRPVWKAFRTPEGEE